MQGKKRHLSEAQKWYFRLMNDPKQFEKERFIDSINEFNRIIKEFEKLYDETPTTDHLIRDEILYGMSSLKETWQKFMPNTRCLRNTRPELQ